MKKIAAILLLLLLAFNWYGYRLVLSAMQNSADRKLEAVLDNSQYDESQLIEVRVTMDLPYQQRFTDFERAYGEVEVNGKTYTYVKRKVEGDVVILKCINNTSKQQLKSIDSDLTRANSGTDNDRPGNQQKNSFAKCFWSEYDGEHTVSLSDHGFDILKSSASFYSFDLSDVSLLTPHQPPKC